MVTDKIVHHDDIHEVLRRHWGYTAFRPMQERIIHEVLAGRDTLALLPTGGGKSLCFQVPGLAQEGVCLVISPLIALMKDQVERLRSMHVSARAIISGMKQVEIDNALESTALGKVRFLYVSPERLGSEMFKARLHRMPLSLIAVDEAHCISQWGYDFRPAYQRIAELREVHPNVPMLALTATATPQVSEDIMAKLGFRKPNLLRGGFQRPELTFWVSRGEDRQGRLLRILKHLPGTAIVYLRDRRGTVRIAQFLQRQGISCAAYHAGMAMDEREKVQQQWTSGALRVVAATNAFGMGIDKADVRCVIHLEAPGDLESYYQEAGRAGRDGQPAHAFLLTAPGDEERLRERLLASFPEEEEVRRVYQSFADLHQIAHGAGHLESYALDLPAMAERTGLRQPTVMHALKALELDGKIALSEGARTPSRVLMTTDARTAYDMRVSDQRWAPLLEGLLRMHGGLFEEPVAIEEQRLAQFLRWPVAKVYKGLGALQQLGMLSYAPRSEAPLVTLLTPRWDAARLRLDPEALAARKQRAIDRADAMAHFAYRSGRCREQELLAYFGEDRETRCGRCDNCAREWDRAKPPPLSTVAEPSAEMLEAARWAMDDEAAADRRRGKGHVEDGER